MSKLTAEKCRHHIERLSNGGEQRCLSIYEEDYLQALEIALPVLVQQGGWISCSERMPEIGQQVLVTNRHFHTYEVAIFDVGQVSGKGYFGASSGKFIATHWQPLPAPPQTQPSSTTQIDNDGGAKC